MDNSSSISTPTASVASAKPASQSQIPSILLHGVPMIKLSNKKVKQRTVWLSAEGPSIRWDSRKLGIVRMDQIREVRYGQSASPSQPVPGLTESARTRWITIVYTQLPASWKTLNIVALKDDDFDLWLETISNLLGAIRGISVSLGNGTGTGTGNAGGGVIGITGDKSGVAGMGLHQRDSCWIQADEDQDEKISYEEVCRACKRMGIVINDSNTVISKYCRSIDTDGKGHLTIADFTLLLKMLKRQPEIQEIYESLTRDGPLDIKRFGGFLREVQKTAMPENEINRIYAGLVRQSEAWNGESTSLESSSFDDSLVASEPISATSLDPKGLSLEQFTSFLSSPANAVLHPSQRKVCQDMTRPLPDYFISSSHNTYLIGHQWKGESTVEGYVRALLAGCRSVEMDIYDGDDEPIVYHGKTLTGSVPVRAVCVAIASYAFMASPYPIIISAEMHCGPEQQLKLVDILRDVFGEQLVATELNTIRRAEATAELAELPSPEQLKYRILFKSKRSLEPVQGSDAGATSLPPISDSTDTTESSEPDHPLSRSPRARTFLDKVTSRVAQLTTSPPASPPVSLGQGNPRMPKRSSSLDSRGDSFPMRRTSSSSSAVKMSGKQKIVPELAELMIYTAGVKYRGFSKLVEYKAEEMFSVSEKVGTKILRATPLDFIKHNRAHLSRVYPSGTRLTSTNYLPHHFWAMGAQLVALNWQTCDDGFAFNAAMFARNGRSGYILKPTALRSRSKELLAQKERHILHLTILSGQSLPLPSDVEIDDSRLYIEAIVYAPGIDAAKSVSSIGLNASKSAGISTAIDTCSGRTKTVNGNAYNPLWKENLRLSFDAYSDLLDLTFVKVEIKTAVTIGDDVAIAHYCGSLGTLEQGKRLESDFSRLCT